ncbi:MAG: type II toxin-antitoxin system VapC family toxin [Chloroflexi bacterium]|nr:type II toxin-antitoxin system VapC family toxin [Chloroflexota bacterium]
MLVAIADTHVAIWYLFDDKRLSATARSILEDAAAAGNQVGLSSITLAEIVYLIEKERIQRETLTRLLTALDSPNSALTEVAFDRRIAQTIALVDRLSVPDLPDRIIAATALYLNVPLISRDRKIQLSTVTTVW